MDVNDRIRNISEYFAVFNVQDGAVCVGVHFPDKWTLFDVNTICNEFDIQIKSKDNITYFLCDINNGFDAVFNAIDFIIEENKSLEEKTTLLKQKVEELRTLFEQEPLEKLQTLQFVFGGYDNSKEEDSLPQIDDVILPVDIKKQLRKNSKKNEASQEPENKIVINDEQPIKETKRNKRKSNPEDSSFMNYVKEELDNE